MHRFSHHARQYLLVILMLLPTLAIARKDTIRTNQGVEIFVKSNQSKKLHLIVDAHLADIESSASDFMRLGGGIGADYIWRRFVSVHGSYKWTYFSLMQQQTKEENFTENKLKGFSVGSAGVRLHILDGKGWSRRKITLQSFRELNEKGMPRTTVRYLVAKYPCRRIVALRGGVYYSNAPINANLNADVTKILETDVKGSVLATDGTKFTGAYHTNMYTTGLYAGITKIINMKMRTSSTIEWLEGESILTALFRENYIDVIFANTTIDPFVVKGKAYEVATNVPGGFSISNIGWRVGGRLISTDKLINAGASYEIGSRPGLAQRGAYVHIGVTLALMK